MTVMTSVLWRLQEQWRARIQSAPGRASEGEKPRGVERHDRYDRNRLSGATARPQAVFAHAPLSLRMKLPVETSVASDRAATVKVRRPVLSVSPARKIAYQILRRVDSGRYFAVDLLQGREVSALDERDRRLATELVMGVLRWRGELDYQIERLAGRPVARFDPEILTILRLGVYQIRHLERVPKPVVVNEAVELAKAAHKRSAAALANAVLRKCDAPTRPPEREVRDELAQPGAACRSIPEWLRDRWIKHFGAEAARCLAWESVRAPHATLRVRGAGGRDEIRGHLAAEGVRTRLVRYAPQALVVEAGSVQSGEVWREGRVVIQDEASQLVAELLHAGPEDAVLDLCAAPGMKTAQIAETLGAGLLVSCDRSVRRLQTLARRLDAKGAGGARPMLVQLDATQPLPFRAPFHRILLDAPCSGTGTLGRNPEIKWRLRPDDLTRLAGSQSKMLAAALDCLAPGGRLVYATCSLEPEENEEVVERVVGAAIRRLGRDDLAREFPVLAPLFDASGYFRTRPDRDAMDGFFAAVIERWN